MIGKSLAALALIVLAVGSSPPARAQSAPREVVAELAPTGTLRAAINFGNAVLAQRDAAGGPPRGVSGDLARSLAERLSVPVAYVAFDTAGKVTESAGSGQWDICFLAIDPVRAAGIDFSPPYVVIEGVYAVPSASALRALADMDRAGVRIAVGRGSAYDLFLTRSLKQATLVRAPTSAAALDSFLADRLEAVAGVKQPVVAFAQTHPDVRVISEPFMAIEQAMGTLRGRPAGLRYLRRFVEEMKASGFVADALRRSGQPDATVAPATAVD